jgi:hypothetical protein
MSAVRNPAPSAGGRQEGRALGGLNNAQLPGPELAPRNAGHEDRAGDPAEGGGLA